MSRMPSAVRQDPQQGLAADSLYPSHFNNTAFRLSDEHLLATRLHTYRLSIPTAAVAPVVRPG